MGHFRDCVIREDKGRRRIVVNNVKSVEKALEVLKNMIHLKEE